MSDGGFLLKFNGKNEERCHTVKLDYDNWQITVNNIKTQKLLGDLKEVTIVVEHPEK